MTDNAMTIETYEQRVAAARAANYSVLPDCMHPSDCATLDTDGNLHCRWCDDIRGITMAEKRVNALERERDELLDQVANAEYREREACARVAESFKDKRGKPAPNSVRIADAIRERRT